MNFLRILGITAVLPLCLFAHGEDKPGPHGGHIRMPGGFHVELIQTGRDLKIYLLDINFKNAVTEDSAARLTFGSATSSTCHPEKDYFVCGLPKTFKDSGKVTVEAQRKGMEGVAEYELPLSFQRN